MKELSTSYRKHIFVCTNDRLEGSCCNKVNGYGIFHALKEYVLSNGLANAVWVTRTGCLGFCNDIGTTVVLYPEKKWFTKVTKDDLPKIIEEIHKRMVL